MMRQQSTVNALFWHALTQSRQQQHDVQQRTALTLTEYLSGQAQEISELSQEVDRLKRRMAELSEEEKTK